MCLVYANSKIACHCLQGPLTGMGWGWGMLTFLALAPMLYATRKLTFLALAPAILRSLNIPWDTCTWCMLHNRHQTCAGSIVYAAAKNSISYNAFYKSRKPSLAHHGISCSPLFLQKTVLSESSTVN